jgi:hypothetical protein
MGVLGDYAKRWMNWQKDAAEAANWNDVAAKNKKRIADTKVKLAKMRAPIPYGDSVSPTRRAAKRGNSLSEEELDQMGFGKQEGTTD